MSERPSDRWISLFLSVLLHGAVVALLGYGWWLYQQRPKPIQPTLAIEATAVDPGTLPSNTKPLPEPEPEPAPPPEPEPVQPEPIEPAPEPEPPQPSPEEIARQQEEERRRLEEEQRIAEEKRLAEERAEAERKAREEAEAKKREEERRLAEQKRKEEEKRRAEEKRKREEARLRAEREAELRKALEEEERLMQARASGVMSSWIAQIQAKIQRAWLRPPSAQPGIECVVYVTQVPGGEIVNVRIGACNGDQAVRDSIESAVHRASPLPPPPDPALFERNLVITFKPTD